MSARYPSWQDLALANNRGESFYRDFSQPPPRYDSATGLPPAGRSGPITWLQGADGPVPERGDG